MYHLSLRYSKGTSSSAANHSSNALRTDTHISADVRVHAIEVQAGVGVKRAPHAGLSATIATVESAELGVEPSVADSVAPLYH